MSEGKETNFFNKLKTDKKFRFEFIMAVWSGIVGIALVVGLVFVGKTFFFGKKVVDSGDLGDETPAVVTEQAIDAEETPAPYDSAIVSGNEEDFQDDEEAVDDNLKDAKTAYATTVVNIRKEAALTADVIGKLQTGDEVKIIEYGKEWTKVEVNGTQGYVSTIYLSTKKPAEEPTTTAAPRTTSAPKATATATPKPTKRPKATKKPKVTKRPATHAPTQEPQETQAPEITKAPEPTKAPDPTKAPEPTKAPDPTKAPEPEKTPEQTSPQEG